MTNHLIVASVVLVCGSAARGVITVPGADGSDGAFNPAGNTVIDLAGSPNGAWDAPNPSAPIPRSLRRCPPVPRSLIPRVARKFLCP